MMVWNDSSSIKARSKDTYTREKGKEDKSIFIKTAQDLISTTYKIAFFPYIRLKR